VGRDALKAFVGALVIVSITLVAGEVLIRIIKPMPKTQVIRQEKTPFFVHQNIPIWIERDRMNFQCPQRYPEAKLIAFVGYSIFYGAELEDSDVFTNLMQQRLDAEHGKGAWCILNLSQPGYSFEQKHYWYSQLIAEHPPDIVLWILWPTEAFHYRLIGDYIYNVKHIEVDADNMPVALPGPNWLKVLLLNKSRLFEYGFLAMSLSKPLSTPTVEYTKEYISKLKQIEGELAALGGEFQLVGATKLNMPFDQMTDRGWEAGYLTDSSVLFENFDVLFLRDLLMEENAKCEEVRLDTCCHFNEKGHQVLADIFLKILKARFGGQGQERGQG